MSVDTPIHQRIKFILSRFIAVLCCSEDQKKIIRKDMNVGPAIDYQLPVLSSTGELHKMCSIHVRTEFLTYVPYYL